MKRSLSTFAVHMTLTMSPGSQEAADGALVVERQRHRLQLLVLVLGLAWSLRADRSGRSSTLPWATKSSRTTVSTGADVVRRDERLEGTSSSWRRCPRRHGSAAGPHDPVFDDDQLVVQSAREAGVGRHSLGGDQNPLASGTELPRLSWRHRCTSTPRRRQDKQELLPRSAVKTRQLRTHCPLARIQSRVRRATDPPTCRMPPCDQTFPGRTPEHGVLTRRPQSALSALFRTRCRTRSVCGNRRKRPVAREWWLTREQRVTTRAPFASARGRDLIRTA